MNFDEIKKIYNRNKYTLKSNNKNNSKIITPIQDVQFNNKLNPRLWHALNKLCKINNKHTNMNAKQIYVLNRFVNKKIIYNKKLFTSTFTIK